MTSVEAIEECRRAYRAEAPGWCLPLVRFLDQPPDVVRLFAWLERCIRHLLLISRKLTPDLETELTELRSLVLSSPASDSIESRFWALWAGRSPDDPTRTAMAKLYRALLSYRRGEPLRHSDCIAPICILWRMAPDRDQVFEEVIRQFTAFILERRCG